MSDWISDCSALEVILKVTERCNINCAYCYMFNRGNDDYLHRPAIMTSAGQGQIVQFLERGILDLGVKRVNIVMHGGEPLMMGKRRFSKLCGSLVSRLGGLVTLNLGIQTNAILIDEDWIEIFAEFDIQVGVSLDGPAHINDRHRVDKEGRGTYHATHAGIDLLHDAHRAGKIVKAGAICVINPKTSAKDLYQHFVYDLDFQQVSFNLPMETVDSAPDGFGEECGHFLQELFEVWTSDGRTDVRIRIFDKLLRYLAGDEALQELLPNFITKHIMVVIASDGELSEHDDYKVINFAQRGGSIFDTSLKEFANSPLRQYIHHVAQTLPGDCKACDWKRYCRAGVTHGLTVSRYSEHAGFDNASILCDAFVRLYTEAARYLLKNGLDPETLYKALGSENAALEAGSLEPIPESLRPRKKDFLAA